MSRPSFPLSESHRLLLQAALWEDERAVQAWLRWQALTDWQNAPVDWPSYRLLPAVYKNLKKNSPDTPGMPRLKGLYRRAWYENTRLLHASLPAFQALAGAGIPLLFFKGISLARHYYDDLAARPMGDLDVLVPEDKTHQALQLLLDSSWRVEHPYFSAEGLFYYYHGVNLGLPPAGHIDLHRRLFADELTPGLDEMTWQAAWPIDLEGLPVLRLCAADELLLACMHGWRWEEFASIRWIVDASYILKAGPVDWERVLAEASRRRMTLRAGQALAYLQENFGLPIPQDVMKRLQARPAAAFEKKEADWALRPQGVIPITVYKIYYWYLRQHGMPGGLVWWWGLLMEYVNYLRLTPSLGNLPTWLKKRLRLAGLVHK